MNAVIMAGGKGARLRPLTDQIPKPMVGFFGRPMLEHQIALLQRQGIVDIIITVGHLQQCIVDHFGNGRRFGVEIRYVQEEQPLGTAGGVKQAEPMLDDTFLVLSGDTITDADLVLAIGFHLERHSDATLILTDVDDPSQYHIVETMPDGRVRRFAEEPTTRKSCSRSASVGLYVMSCASLREVPTGKAFDFGKNLFPQMLERGRRLFGLAMTGAYWNNIISLPRYLQAHLDALEGKINLPTVHARTRRVQEANVHRDARVEEPSFINGMAHIHDKALVRQTFVGTGAHVGIGSQLRRCVVSEGCIVGDHSVLTDCVLSPGTVVPPHSHIHDGLFSLRDPNRTAFAAQVRQEQGVTALGTLN